MLYAVMLLALALYMLFKAYETEGKNMRIRTYHPQLSFSGAPEASDFKALSQQGYRLIVNNRPDEEPGSILTISKRKRWLNKGNALRLSPLHVRYADLGDRLQLPVSAAARPEDPGALQERGSLCLPFPAVCAARRSDR